MTCIGAVKVMLLFAITNYQWAISDCLRSSKLKALEGRPIIAPGKRLWERRPG